MLNQPSAPPEPAVKNSPVSALSVLAWLRQVTASLWTVYVVVMVLGVLGLVATRWNGFTFLMFVATIAYLSLQVVSQVFRLRSILTVIRAGRTVDRAVALGIASVASVLLMCICAYVLRPTPNGQFDLNLAAATMLGGGIALFIALFVYRTTAQAETLNFTFAGSVVNFGKGYTLLITLGILLLLVTAEISGDGLKIAGLPGTAISTQGLLFWGGVVLLTFGMAGSSGIGWLRGAIGHLRTRDPHWWLVVGVIVLAFFLRAWALESALPLSVDDGSNIPAIWPVLGDKSDYGLVIASSNTYTTQLYSQFLVVGVRLFGYNLAALRAVAALFGTINVIALYLLAEALFNRRVALIAALVLATFPPHIHFSRLIFAHVIDATFGTFAIAFLIRAMKYNRRTDWALAGITLGLTQYFFEAGRLFFPPLIIIWLVLMAIFNFRSLRQFWRGLGLMVISALLIAMPTYYAVFARNAPATSRINVSGVGLDFWVSLYNTTGLTGVFNRAISPFLVFVHRPEYGLLYYGGTHPIVLETLVPLLLLGFFFALWHFRRPGIIIAIWIFSTGAANLVMLETANYTRFIVGIPALALAIAAGIHYLTLMAQHFGNRRLVSIATILLVAIIGLSQTSFYFNEQLPGFRRQIRYSVTYPDPVDAALRTVKLPLNTQAYLVSTSDINIDVPRLILTFYMFGVIDAPQIGGVTVANITPDFVRNIKPDVNLAFFIEPGHPEIVDFLKANFVLDEPQYTQNSEIEPNKGFVLYYAALKNQPPRVATKP